MLNTLLWIGEGVLAVVFTLAGTLKVVAPREQLETRMHWAKTWPRERIKLLGFAELAGAVGLVLPRALGIAPVLTPVAALCLAALMIGAVQTHRRLGESAAAPAVIGGLCAVLAIGLWAAGGH